MSSEEDVLDLIRDIPSCLGDTTVATELKYITLGAVLSKCADEIVRLRRENERLKRETKTRKKM